MATSLRDRWQVWSARFAALQLREKYLIIGAAAVAVLFIGHSVWIEPGQIQTARLKKDIAQQQNDMEQLRLQLTTLAQNNKDPNAANREALQALRQQLSDTARELKTFEGVLVAPTQVPALLQTLLNRHRGLTLMTLKTLPPEPLVKPAGKSDGKEPAKPAVSQGSSTAPEENIYKHGIELRVTGSYHDLLAYVAELEASPQKLLWGNMILSVSKDQPGSELTLTFYTLSLETTWLIV